MTTDGSNLEQRVPGTQLPLMDESQQVVVQPEDRSQRVGKIAGAFGQRRPADADGATRSAWLSDQRSPTSEDPPPAE